MNTGDEPFVYEGKIIGPYEPSPLVDRDLVAIRKESDYVQSSMNLSGFNVVCRQRVFVSSSYTEP